MEEIVKIGEVYSEQIRDLSYLHDVIFINNQLHAEGDMIMIKLRAEYEKKYNKNLRDFNVFEIEALKKEFREEMENVYRKYEDRIEIR